MKMINVNEARADLSNLLDSVKNSGASFIICRNGKPVAKLVPHKRASRTEPHPTLSKIKIGYDPVEPLSGDEWQRQS